MTMRSSTRRCARCWVRRWPHCGVGLVEWTCLRFHRRAMCRIKHPHPAPQDSAPRATSNPQPGGLKWNAAGSLVRAANQGRQQMGQQPGSRLPDVQPHLPQELAPHQPHQSHVHRPPGLQSITPATSFQSHHHSNSHQPQQSAQLSELQRQVEQYKQQLMFAQQELNEVRRARRGPGATGATGDVGQQYDVPRTVAHHRLDQTKAMPNGEMKANVDSPSANNKRQRGMSTPPSVSISTYNTTNDTLMSIVPRFIGQVEGRSWGRRGRERGWERGRWTPRSCGLSLGAVEVSAGQIGARHRVLETVSNQAGGDFFHIG